MFERRNGDRHFIWQCQTKYVLRVARYAGRVAVAPMGINFVFVLLLPIGENVFFGVKPSFRLLRLGCRLPIAKIQGDRRALTIALQDRAYG